MNLNGGKASPAPLSNAPATTSTAGGVEIPENTIVTKLSTAINGMVEAVGGNVVVNAGRKFSLWPMPFATACCGIELMAVGASRFDIARFGAEVMRFSPRQCDLLIVAGRVAMKMMPVLQRIWLQMPEPKWCISMGACACTGGVFDTYAVVQGVDRFIPVDVLHSRLPAPARADPPGPDGPSGQDPSRRHACRHRPARARRAREDARPSKGSPRPGSPWPSERGDEDRFGYRLPGGPRLARLRRHEVNPFPMNHPTDEHRGLRRTRSDQTLAALDPRIARREGGGSAPSRSATICGSTSRPTGSSTA